MVPPSAGTAAAAAALDHTCAARRRFNKAPLAAWSVPPYYLPACPSPSAYLPPETVCRTFSTRPK